MEHFSWRNKKERMTELEVTAREIQFCRDRYSYYWLPFSLWNQESGFYIILQNIIKYSLKAIFIGFYFKNITNKQIKPSQNASLYRNWKSRVKNSVCLLFRAFWLFLMLDAQKHGFSEIKTCHRQKKNLFFPPSFCYFLTKNLFLNKSRWEIWKL